MWTRCALLITLLFDVDAEPAFKKHAYLATLETSVTSNDGMLVALSPMNIFLTLYLRRDVTAHCTDIPNLSLALCEDELFLRALLTVEDTFPNLFHSGRLHNVDIAVNDTVLRSQFRSVAELNVRSFDVACEALDQTDCQSDWLREYHNQVWILYYQLLSDYLGQNFVVGNKNLSESANFGLHELWDDELMLSRAMRYCEDRYGVDHNTAFRECLVNLHSSVYTFGSCMQRVDKRLWTNAPKRLSFIEHVFVPKDPLIYIGGNTGSDLSIFLTKLPNTTVYIFEPLELYAHQLIERYRDNALVKVFMFGMGASDGSACFEVSGTNGDATTQIKDSFSAGLSDGRSRVAGGAGESGNMDNIECASIANASRIIFDELSSPTGKFSVHMNCEGCEYDVIDSWIQTGAIHRISVLQFGSHNVDWVPSVKHRYCRLHLSLLGTHDVDFSEPWCWERWLPHNTRWEFNKEFGDPIEIVNDVRPVESLHEPLNVPAVREGVAVYSVYCNIKPSYYVSPPVAGIPSYFLTDNTYSANAASAMGWITIDVGGPPHTDDGGSNMKCKLPRTQPHLYRALDKHKYLVYIDHNHGSKLARFSEWKHLLNFLVGPLGFPVIMFKSEAFQTVDAEFKAAMLQERYNVDRNKYLMYMNGKFSEGFKGDLVCRGGFAVRNMDHHMSRVIGAAWYSEILLSGIEDQISLAFVVEKYSSFIRILHPYRLSVFW